MTNTEKLFAIIGPDRFVEVMAALGGKKVYIPKHHLKVGRNDHIIALFSESLKQPGASCQSSYKVAAKDVGLSIRQVQRVVAGS
mgnify:CR=1 FL=1|jgi:hypothetical protein